MKPWHIALALLAAALVVVALIAYAWVRMGDVDMSWAGIAAMIGGVLVALGLGMGLMGLAFYSSRSGRDDDVGRH